MTLYAEVVVEQLQENIIFKADIKDYNKIIIYEGASNET
jgi:hypothetical protein